MMPSRTLRFALVALVLAAGAARAQTGQLPNNTVWGNVSGAQAPASPLSKTQITTLCNAFGASLLGCVPSSGGGTVNFLRADGSWATPPGVPGGSSGQVQTNNGSGGFGGLTNTQLTALINLATASLPGALPAWPNTTTTYFRGDGTYQTLNCAALSGVGTGCAAAAGITALTGDISATGPGSAAATLATVNSNVGTFGSSSQCVTLTVNAKGLVTGASATTCAPALTTGDIYVGQAGIATPVPVSGDCTITTSGVLTCTKTNGVAFAPSATTDTTNASNITSGQLGSLSRLPSLGLGQVYQVPQNGSAGAPSAQTARTLLTATTTFYANADSGATHPCGANTCQPGSDSNNCASFSTPCQTIQHTLALIASLYDFGGQSVTLQLADGTYGECVLLPPYVTTSSSDKNVFILGHSGSAASVIVNCTTASSNTFTAVNVPQGWYIQNLTLKATNACIDADYHSAIYLSGVVFSACTNIDVEATNTGALVEFFGNYTASDSVVNHASAIDGGEVLWSSVTVTVSGSPTYSDAFFRSRNGGVLDSANLTISGSFSGAKYDIVGRPVYFSSGATATTTNSTQYLGLSSIANSEINYYTFASPTNGIVELYANTTAAPGVGQSLTITFRLGGSGTALTCTISGANTLCSDLVHSTTAISGNNVIDVQVVSSATAATGVVSASAILQ